MSVSLKRRSIELDHLSYERRVHVIYYVKKKLDEIIFLNALKNAHTLVK